MVDVVESLGLSMCKGAAQLIVLKLFDDLRASIWGAGQVIREVIRLLQKVPIDVVGGSLYYLGIRSTHCWR